MRSAPRREPSSGVRRGLAAALAVTAGAVVAVEAARRVPSLSGPPWVRQNHRGDPVSLVAGPISAVTASVAAAGLLPSGYRRPVLLLGLSCGAVGLYDDIAGAGPDQKADKGFRGHLRALRSGRVSAGAVKVAGVVGASVAAAGSVSTGPIDRIIAGGVIAGVANLVNLFDLRPGRAAKVTALAAAATLGGNAGGLSAAVLGTCLGVLPADLGEKVMLGDSGANALGALLGFRLAADSRPAVRAGILAALVALTAASEKVSFTRVIESTPGLREFDRWGRLCADTTSARR